MNKKCFFLALFFLCGAFFINKAEVCCFNEIENSPFPTQINPEYVAYSPDGQCLAVTNVNSDSVSIFAVDQSNCNLMSRMDFLTNGTQPRILAYSPNGNCLAVTNTASDTVTIFQVTGCTLSDDPVTRTTGTTPLGVAFSPDGQCLVVANQGSNTLSVFAVDPDTCKIAKEPATVNTNPLPTTLAFSPNGNCLAVVHSTSPGSISLFSVGEDCALTPLPMPISPISTGGDFPEFLAFSSDGSCLAVPNENSNTIAMFSVNQENCTLTPAMGSPFPTGIGTLPIVPAFSPDGNCLSITKGNTNPVMPGFLTVFSLNDDCQLTQTSTTPLSGGFFPIGITYSPDGKCLSVANFNSNNVTTFAVFSVTISPSSVAVCEGQDFTLTANPFGGVGELSYTWTDPNNNIICGPDPACQMITINNATLEDVGTYTVTVTDTGEPICTVTATVDVIVNPNPTVTIMPPSVNTCEGQEFTLTANPSGGSGTYTNFEWTGPNGLICSGGLECQSITINNASLTDIGLYSVVITDSNGCTAQTTASVAINPNPAVTIDPPFLIICSGQDIELTANPSGGSGIYTSFAWTDPNGFVSDLQTINIPNATQANGGIYQVTVTDSNGCQGTAQAIVIVGTIRAQDERFTTCINQKINFLPRTIFFNASAFLVPEPNTPQLGAVANAMFDPILQSLTVELILGPSFGQLILNENGSFTYIPAFNFIGQDSFTYKISSNEVCFLESTGTVTIQVNQCCNIGSVFV